MRKNCGPRALEGMAHHVLCDLCCVVMVLFSALSHCQLAIGSAESMRRQKTHIVVEVWHRECIYSIVLSAYITEAGAQAAASSRWSANQWLAGVQVCVRCSLHLIEVMSSKYGARSSKHMKVCFKLIVSIH